MATLDDLNKTVSEMRDVLANAKNADGSRDKVLDEGALVATFTKALDQWSATNTAEAVRKGEPVGPISGDEKQPAIVERGKFAGAKVDDLIFADWLMSKANASNAGAPGSRPIPVSNVLELETAQQADDQGWLHRL